MTDSGTYDSALICQKVDGLNGWKHLNVLNIQPEILKDEFKSGVHYRLSGKTYAFILKGEIYVYETGTSVTHNLMKLKLTQCEKSNCEEHRCLLDKTDQWDAKLVRAEKF